MIGYIGRRVYYDSVYELTNTADRPIPIYIEFVPGGWEYAGTPDMSRVEHLRVSIRKDETEVVQVEIRDGMLEKSSGSDTPITLGPGEKALVTLLLRFAPTAAQNDKFRLRLELVTPPGA